MADTKINPSSATPNPSPALTDTFPVYSSGQASSDKFVNSITQVKTLVYPATTGLTAVVTPATSDIHRVTQGGTEKQETTDQIRQAILNDADYNDLISRYPSKGIFTVDHMHDPGGPPLPGWVRTVSGSAQVLSTAVGASAALFQGETRTRVLTNTALGYAIWGNQIYMGAGKFIMEWRLYPIWTAEVAKLQFGLGDTSIAADADQVNGIYWEYDVAVSANWVCACAKSSTRSKVSSGVAFASATIFKFRIEVAANLSQVEFFINDASVRTETSGTAIPLSTKNIRPYIGLYKRSGAQGSNTDVWVDYMTFNCKYTTAV